MLHLGFIQHSHLYEKLIGTGDWLHGQIHKVARRLVGIDYLASDVDVLRKKYGYECYHCDVTKMENLELKDQFDIIVCGELIEHVENPGLMLDNIKRFMRPDSVLLITTPNPWEASRITLINSGKLEESWLNDEHVCWYTFGTLKQLLDRKGFAEIKYDYYYHQKKETLFSTTARIGRKLRIARMLYRASRVQKTNYNGLFFLARLK